MTSKKIFISYSHDSDAHRARVLALSERLRQDGLETILDQYINGAPTEGWSRWMLNQLGAASFVLVVCTPTYYRRFRGHEEPGKGKGADWEGALITNEIYEARSNTLKFVPVFLSAADDTSIPEPLRGGTHYEITSEANYQSLYDFLLGQAGVQPGPVGTPKTKLRPQGTPLSFAAPAPIAPALPALPATSAASAVPAPAARHADSRLPHAADKLVGREVELARLGEAWADPAQRVIIIRGIGGEGKTSLVAEWSRTLGERDFDGASYFDWSFYSQGTRDQTSASSDAFIAEALGFFGGEAGRALANSAASGRDKASHLLDYLRAHRALLVLDGLEPLQHPPGPLAGHLRDEAMAVLLKGLAQRNPGLCVVTTREPVRDLARWEETSAPELELTQLSDAAGASLLRRLLEPPKPKGVHQVRSTEAERQEISRAVKGHALTLRLLGGYIHRALRDVRRWREVDYTQADAQYVTNTKAAGDARAAGDATARYGHAFTTMAAYERWLASGGVAGQRQLAVLRLLGLFDRPASASLLHALRASPVIPHLTEPLQGMSLEEWNTTLSELEECGLVEPLAASTVSDAAAVDAHPLLREYFATQLKTQQPEAWRAGHRRLFEHLSATTQEGKQPSLKDLQPLYQAVAHGCQAGLAQRASDEVYYTRICRQGEAYSTAKLGAFGSELGAVACFFEQPWSRLAPALREATQAWLLNEAAFSLRALGRLGEALEPMQAGLQMRVQQENWEQAARSASNLSELALTLGHIDGGGPSAALQAAGQAVDYADRSGDAFQQMSKRTTHADALHQAGQQDQAVRLFRAAEDMQAKNQPSYPLLYSVGGFRYADLLLAQAERAAWLVCLQAALGDTTTLAEALTAVERRATQTLQWVSTQNWLLDIALDHLTLGRTALYAAVLQAGTLSLVAPAWAASGRIAPETDQAVDGLRRAGQQDQLPRALLTSAWLRHLQGHATGPNSAQSDLDEAWEIAERGPMPLFLTDIHLHRARLFMRDAHYPWDKHENGTNRGPADDLSEARHLIEKHGYGRRKEELEDAEEALRQWQDSTPAGGGAS